MVLKKPSDFFESENKIDVSESIKDVQYFDTLQSYKKNLENFDAIDTIDAISNFSGSLENYNENIEKVNYLSQQLLGVQEEIKTLLTREDLDRAMMSQVLVVEEITMDIQSRVKAINNEKLAGIKNSVTELTEQVNEFISVDLPKYKRFVINSEKKSYSRYDKFEGKISESIETVQQSIDDVRSSVDQKHKEIGGNISEFQDKLTNKISSVKKTVNEFIDEEKENISKNEIRVKKELEKFENELKEISVDVFESSEDNKNFKSDLTERVDNFLKNSNSKFDEKVKEIKGFKEELSKKVSNLEVDLIRNESHIKIQNESLDKIQVDVREAIEKLKIDELEEKNSSLVRKVNYIEEVLEKFSEKEVLTESITEPPATNNSDSLTPTDQNFVTFDQLQNHYRLFVNRIQQQLSTLGGGGETRLEFLDDVDRNSAKVNGKFLKYDSSVGKWVGAGAGAGSQTLDETLGLGNTSSTGMSVGVVTATQFHGGGANITGISTLNIVNYGVGLGGGGGSQTLDETLGLGNTSSLGMSVGVVTTTELHVGVDTGFFTEELVVNGDARITGILSVGTETITLDPTANKIQIGTGITLDANTNSIEVGGSKIADTSGNANYSGILTASSFVGDVTGTATTATNLNNQAASYYLDYDNFTNTPTIPTNNNELTNGAGYITTSFTNTNQLTNGAGFVTFTNNNQLTNGAGYITTSFTNTNQLTNGAGFITTSFTNTNQLTNGAGFITSSDDITGTSGGLTGSPSITVTDITAVGNVSIAGTLTYEDVTNVDSIGIATARTGLNVLSGGINVTGVSTFQSDVYFGDNDYIRLGDANYGDLRIYHAGGAGSYIDHTNSNDLYIRVGSGSGSTKLRITDTSNNLKAIFDTDNTSGGVELYYGFNQKKFETTEQGVGIAGSITVDNDLLVSGVSTFQGNVNLGDNDVLRFGDDIDLEIFSDGSTSYIQESNNSNALWIKSNSTEIRTNGNQPVAKFINDAGAELYYAFGDKKFETTGYGATVFGTLQSQQLNVTGVSTFTNKAEVRSDDGSQGRIDFYCEVSNAHYTRIQAAAHADYSGNAIVTLPSSTGTLLLTDGDGSSLTSLNASNLGSGTIPDARFPTTLPAVSGQNLTGIVTGITAGSNITVLESPSGNFIITATGGGDTVSINASAEDILSASSGEISADDAGSDKLVFWDDSESKLTYLTAGSGLSISGTTITASGGGGGSIGIQSAGVLVGTATTINFGSGVTITNNVASVSVGSTVTFVGARLYHDNYAVTTTNSWAEVTNWDGTAIDTHSFVDASDGFTIPAGVSKVRITVGAKISTNGSSNQWAVYKNGSRLEVNDGGFYVESEQATGFSNGSVTGVTAVLSVVQNDTFDLRHYQTGTIPTWDIFFEIEVIEGDILGTYFSANNIVDDTTPQLGGDLDLNSSDITGTGNMNVTGVITATSFVGDGSGLTNLPGSSGIEIENNGTSVGTAITSINFSTNVTATASGGIATVTASGGGGSVDLLEVMLFT